jgi:very-short-patch-repair endonuclease
LGGGVGRELGVTFRRQFAIDRYIVDLYCPASEDILNRMDEDLDHLGKSVEA